MLTLISRNGRGPSTSQGLLDRLRTYLALSSRYHCFCLFWTRVMFHVFLPVSDQMAAIVALCETLLYPYHTVRIVCLLLMVLYVFATK